MGESAWGHAVVTVARAGIPLSFYFPAPRLGTPDTADRPDLTIPDEQEDPVRAVRVRRQLCVAADLDQPPSDSADAYLRLHLLSHRLVRPNSVNLDGIFNVLPNVCWTSLGPVAVSEIGAARQRALARGIHLEVRSVLFRRNSVTGSVEAITRPGRWGSLSTDLHARQ